MATKLASINSLMASWTGRGAMQLGQRDGRGTVFHVPRPSRCPNCISVAVLVLRKRAVHENQLLFLLSWTRCSKCYKVVDKILLLPGQLLWNKSNKLLVVKTFYNIPCLTECLVI